MKIFGSVLIGLMLMVSLFLTGCGDSDSASPTSAAANGAGELEGQLVADVGTQFAKLLAAVPNNAAQTSGAVYPISGATVELIQNGAVVATTTTDEYGRFRFTNLTPGDYQVRVVSVNGEVAHYHVSVSANQTLTVYGRVLSGECLWQQELGPHWNDMSQGHHWGNGFRGAAPGQGYWHNGQEWCEPQGTGPHGPPH